MPHAALTSDAVEHVSAPHRGWPLAVARRIGERDPIGGEHGAVAPLWVDDAPGLPGTAQPSKLLCLRAVLSARAVKRPIPTELIRARRIPQPDGKDITDVIDPPIHVCSRELQELGSDKHGCDLPILQGQV